MKNIPNMYMANFEVFHKVTSSSINFLLSVYMQNANKLTLMEKNFVMRHFQKIRP